MTTGQNEDARPDPTEEAGETTAADSVQAPSDTRPVGTGTLVETAGEKRDEGT
jgi:hypothetical protein